MTEYPQANRQPARPYLRSQLLRERDRGGHGYDIHVGAVLSGSARIQSRRYRDELARSVPVGIDPIVGGEIERSREIACRNAAEFVLSALENDARK
ncbi:MAG: hypothetical protein ACP5XB_16085 [Isosphaeraceae bacterium]